jgi:hypothetical protein
MNANGRCEGDITDIMRVIRTECARLAWTHYEGLIAKTMLVSVFRAAP